MIQSQNIIYVDADNVLPGKKNGTSWFSAYTDLQVAFSVATSGDSIFVAEGTYYTHASDRKVSFELVRGVAMLGGFDPSNGITELAHRDWETYETILSADIGIAGDTSDNAYHVIYSNNPLITQTTLLDGFTITGGNANAAHPNPDGNGGGLYLSGSSPTLRNCSVTKNYANRNGGGLYLENYQSGFMNSTMLINCDITENHATTGGGLYGSVWNGIMSSGIIKNNKAFQGGGMRIIESDFTLNDISIIENTASFFAAGISISYSECDLTRSYISSNIAYSTGAIHVNSNSILNINNTIISYNSDTTNVGAVYIAMDSESNFINCTIASNQSLGVAGGILNYGAVRLDNSILAHNLIDNLPDDENSQFIKFSGTFEVDHSLIQGGGVQSGGGTNLGGNINADPKFSNLGNFKLSSTSAAINSGNNTLALSNVDIAGVPRILNSIVDMGANEYISGFHWTGLGDGYDWKDIYNWSEIRQPTQADTVLLYTLDAVEILTDCDGYAKQVIVGPYASLYIQNEPAPTKGRLLISGSTDVGLINHGSLFIKGKLSFADMAPTSTAILNYGAITNSNIGEITIDDTVATAIDTYGALTNRGDINITESFLTGIHIAETGSINNTGDITIINDGAGAINGLVTDGTLDNDGNITIELTQSYGTSCLTHPTGQLINNGIFRVKPSSNIPLQVDGELTVYGEMEVRF